MTTMLKLIVLLSATTAVAQTQHYVSPTGSDSNDGSQSSPWATINHASGVAQPGWIVHVAPGKYSSSVSLTTSGTASNCTNGNTASCITFVSDTKWGAKVPPVVTISGSYIVFKDFEIDGTLSGNVCCGIDSTGTTGLQLIGNKIHDTASAGNSTGTCVICVDAGAVGGGHHIIDGNFLYHNNPGSTANNSGQHGIYSELSGDIVRNNIVVDQGGGWCIHGYHNVDNWTVVNNTLANCQNGGIAIGGGGSTQNNTTIINNLVVNSGNSSTGNGGINFRQCGTGMVGQNNMGYGDTPSLYVGSCSSTTESGSQTGSDSSFVNYDGSNAETADFHLATGSAAIGSGTRTCASGHSGCVPTTDFDGNPRPASGSVDIGAYQSGSSAAAPNPPTNLTATVQ